MTRFKEVIDVWFDSGSMPFAQLHYPFENKEEFKNISQHNLFQKQLIKQEDGSILYLQYQHVF